MRKLTYILATLMAVCCTAVVNAQSLSDIVGSVTGGAELTVGNIAGEWKFVGSAVELSSDNVLSSAASTVATSKIEEKLDDLFTKVGIQKNIFEFVFNDDMTFTSNIKSRKLNGTYTIDGDTITLKYNALGSINIGSLTASVTLVNTSMSLLFNADKLLQFISKLSSISSNETLKMVNTLVEQYDGVKIGFELEGEPRTASQTASSAASAASSIFKKLF